MIIQKCTIIGGMSQACNEFESFRKILGQNIRKIREEKNFTQETFAFALNSSPKYIGCLERAEKNPSLPFIYKIAKTLNVTVEKLFIKTMD